MSAPQAYAQAGVDQRQADAAVAAIVEVLSGLPVGRESRQVMKAGHFANVLRLTDELGIALSTDGVGTKLLIAEALGRLDTIGVDCIAMNVNDVLCVGARPIAMLDYIAIDDARPEVIREIGIGLRRGAEAADIEIPGGEIAQVKEIVHGLDLVGACFGTVQLDKLITGDAIRPGDVVIGLPSTGLHANGYTLARKALAGLSLNDTLLGRPLGEILLEPTEIYVRPVLELIDSPVEVRGLAHITSDGLQNLLRMEARVGFYIEDRLEVPPIFRLIEERGPVSSEEMDLVFNMGCGFCCVVPAADEAVATAMLQGHYPTARRIGYATDTGTVEVAPG